MSRINQNQSYFLRTTQLNEKPKVRESQTHMFGNSIQRLKRKLQMKFLWDRVLIKALCIKIVDGQLEEYLRKINKFILKV